LLLVLQEYITMHRPMNIKPFSILNS